MGLRAQAFCGVSLDFSSFRSILRIQDSHFASRLSDVGFG